MKTARATRAGVALTLGLSLLLTGCQTAGPVQGDGATQTIELPPIDTLTPVSDPTSYEGPSTAVVSSPTVDPLTDVAAAKLPVTVQSHDRAGDVAVEVTDTSRVLALSLTGTLSDIVYHLGLGDQLVGRDAVTSFPGSDELPLVVRQGHDIEAESVLGLKPSLILTDLSIGGIDFVTIMRDAGIPVVIVDRAIDATTSAETTRQVAAALGVAPAADALNETVAAAIAAKESEIASLFPENEAKRPRVAFLYVRGSSGIFYLFGEGSGVDGLLTSVGAIDVAEEVGWKGERPMTDEALISMDPDVLLVMSKGLKSAGGVDGLLAAQPAIALTSAGKHRRIIDIDDAALFASGTRTPDVIDALARAIYAPDSLKSGSAATA